MHKPTPTLAKIKWALYKMLPNRFLTVCLSNKQPLLALTFDDGPHPEITPRILDLLDQYNIKATFFLIGENIQAHPELAKETVARGHSLGNHSLHHKRFITMPLSEQMQEIRQTEQLLQAIDGKTRHSFRPPNGFLNISLFVSLILKRIPIVLWSLNSLDYLYKDPKQLADEFTDTTAVAGDVLLLHDDAQHTVDALKILIPRWQKLGFGFVDCASMI